MRMVVPLSRMFARSYHAIPYGPYSTASSPVEGKREYTNHGDSLHDFLFSSSGWLNNWCSDGVPCLIFLNQDRFTERNKSAIIQRNIGTVSLSLSLSLSLAEIAKNINCTFHIFNIIWIMWIVIRWQGIRMSVSACIASEGYVSGIQ
jgi:hypothetical protein